MWKSEEGMRIDENQIKRFSRQGVDAWDLSWELWLGFVGSNWSTGGCRKGFHEEQNRKGSGWRIFIAKLSILYLLL